MTDAARNSSRMGWLSLGPLGARRRPSGQESTGGGMAAPRGRLFRKYVLLIVGLVSVVLLINSALDFWFAYEENKAALFRIQQEKAGSAARRIEQFVDEIERQLGWTTAPQWAASPLEQRRFDYVRLLRQVPAITELIQLDDTGKEQLKVSRLAIDVVGSEKDYSQSPSFVEAKKNRVWFSPVYFRKESEPYMTVALARAGRSAGVTVAEVNLKLIWDVITGLKIGQRGYAYVVDRDGRLIAHPDISLVLRNTDLANLPQVASALAEAPSLPSPADGAGSGWGRPIDQAVMVAKGVDGKPVLTAHAAIAPLGWTVFVELPLNEALAPLYGSALRTAALLALALVLATLAALLLARRMTVPIRELRAGAARIGAGELDRHIDIQTGDELEDLAGDFNRMAADLQKSYADLEKKVEDRTVELKEALDQQTASAEVLGVINSSPGDLAPIFDAVLDKATRFCDAAFGTLWTYDGERFKAVALQQVPEAYAEFLSQAPIRPVPFSGLGRVAAGENVAHFLDVAANEAYRGGDPGLEALLELGKARSTVAVPLRKDNAVLGAITAYRQEVRPFSDKQIALLQNFAAQAVIAMENARLINETREALERQTATAEVLQVINSSPGDLAPVFQSIVEKAHTLCGAACGSLQLWDGEKFRGVAMRGFSEAMVEQLRLGYSPSDMPCQRIVQGEHIVHCVDLAEIDSPVAREGGVKLGGVRTILYVALRKDDVLLGQIVAARQEVRPFSEKEIALVENFAAQAVIAMENARLLTETREALEQQTATAEVLQVINSSPGELAPVFDAMLEKAHTLCGAAHGSLQLYDGENLHAVATHAVSDKFADILRQGYRAADSPASQALIEGKPFAYIADCAEIDHPVFRSAAEFAGIRTVLFVPLRKDGAFLGLISAARLEVRPFSEKEIALLQNFAAQAVIAMENARLITETREALEQQTATAEVLGVINSSPGDLAPVFDAMLAKTIRLCEAAHGHLLICDGEVFHPAAVYAETQFAEYWRAQQGPIRPSEGNPLARLLKGEGAVHIADARESDVYRNAPAYREMIDVSGIRTSLTVPLRKDSVLLGAIRVYRREVRPFSEKQIALVENFAAQAVIAMENARLITETREALEQQTATAEVLQVINSSPGDLAPVFDAMLEKAHSLCGVTIGALEIWDGEWVRALATRGLPPEFEDLIRQGYEPEPNDPHWALVSGDRFVHVPNLGAIDDPTSRTAASIVGTGTFLAVPLRKDDALLGRIVAARQEVRPFAEKEIALLENFAAQAVVAMENARLITETREALEQQTATAEVLGVINSSPGDLTPVFDAMLERAMRLCGGSFGVFATYEGEHYRVTATRGLPPGLAEFVRDPIAIQPGSMPERLRRGEDTVQIPDIAALDSEHRTPGLVAMIELGKARTALWVGLRKDGVRQGFFGIYRQEVRPFTDKQIALLQNFAAQAVIAMENARLITETREALEQQTATAEVLQVINSSPGDLAPVFEAMLEKALHLCEADLGGLYRFDGQAVHPVAARGGSKAAAEILQQSFVIEPGSSVERLVRGEDDVVQVRDIIDTEAYRSGAAYRVKFVELTGARTALWVALRKDEALIGVFVIYRQEVRPFPDKQIALLQNFAAQAVIAMENTRLITETREALEQQTATAEVLQVINSSPGELAPVFDAILEKAHSLCGAAYGSLQVYDGEYFRAVAMRGLPEELANQLQQGYRGSDTPASRPLVEGEDVVQISDLAEIDHPMPRRAVELAGMRTLLSVALRKDEALLGLIVAGRKEVRTFTDKEIALLQNFAAQAVIAMENARLITETREALEQQTATAEVLQAINSSPGDLAPVFESMLEKATRLCEAPFGILRTWDGEHFHFGAVHGDPRFCDWVRQRGPIRPDRDASLLGRIQSGERVVRIADAQDDEGYRASSGFREMAKASGIRSAVTVALHKDDALLGIITVYRQEVRPFSDKQIALLENFAAQAVIAMENARLITETREALEQQTATAEVLQVINSSPGDLAPIFDAMLDKATRLCEAAFGTLFTYDGECFHAVALRGVPAVFADALDAPVRPEPGASLYRIARGEPFAHFADVANEAAFRGPAASALVELGGARSTLAVPLRKDDALLGAFAVYRQEVRPFSEKQIALLQNFAAQAVIAMENARLITETREALEQQTATAEVLGVINSSPGDLAPVFDAILEKAHTLCGAAEGSLLLYDHEHFRAVATRGVPEPFADRLRHGYQGSDTPASQPLMAGARFVHIPDLAEVEHPMARAAVEHSGNRTLLSVPLRKGDALFGMIVATRQEVRPFSDKQIALLQNFAAQAVIAMENVRLITELRQRTRDLQESLEYQTATSDVLKVISQSGAELDPVLQTLVETAARICEADKAVLQQARDGLFRIGASFGFTQEWKDYRARNPIAPDRSTPIGRMALERRVVHVEDVLNDLEFTEAESQRLGGFRTMLAVPLFRANTVIGGLFLARSRVEPFTEKQIALVTTFADQAVIAIENARLFNELRARTTELGSSVAELKMLNEVAQAVSSTLDLRTVLSTVLNASLGVTWANAGAVFRYSRAERAFRLVEAVGWDEALAHSVRELRVAETESAMGEAVARRTPIQLADLAQRASYPLRDVTLAAGFHSALIVPLVGAERILGAILLMRQEAGEFPAETVRLMQTLASQSVLAIQNARLFREIADKSEQLALASQHKSQFLANMSHELRTPLNAILGYAELLVDGIYGVLPDRPKGVLERIQNNGKHLLALINDVLDLAKIEAGQLTLTLEDYSLPEVVKSVVTATEPLATSKGLKFTAAVQDDLPMAHGDARRVSQVLLNLVGNAIKFTDKGEVEIRAGTDKGQFVLTVRDTGPGIADADQERIFGEFQQIDNSNTRKKGGTGLGLAISKRMVETQGGTISVDSILGQGSTFRVVLPVHVDEMMEAA